MKPKDLDFGNVLVNSQEVKSLVLLNDGNCTLYYRLVLEQHRPKGLNNDSCGTEAWAGAGPGRGACMCPYVCVCLRSMAHTWYGSDKTAENLAFLLF